MVYAGAQEKGKTKYDCSMTAKCFEQIKHIPMCAFDTCNKYIFRQEDTL
jgi:hypothetical protein